MLDLHDLHHPHGFEYQLAGGVGLDGRDGMVALVVEGEGLGEEGGFGYECDEESR